MEIILKTKNKKSAFALLFGIKDLSIEENLITINELKEMNRENIFISLNKNMFNSDLSFLEETLIELNKLKVKGVLFYDLAVLSITKRLNLDLNLIWAGDFLTTSYKACEFYEKEGVKGVALSNVLTKDEIIEIAKSKNAVKAVEYAEENQSYQNVNLARRYVNKVQNESEKAALNTRLDVVKKESG